MAESVSLEDLVLGYCQEFDGLVEPPAYGSYEVLLPDEVADRLGTESHQRLAFSPEVKNSHYIHFGHTLVDSIVDELRQKTANARFFVNNVRLEKPGLYGVTEKAFSLPNAKMFSVQGSTPKIQMHHYVRLNFKVTAAAMLPTQTYSGHHAASSSSAGGQGGLSFIAWIAFSAAKSDCPAPRWNLEHR